jgi:hypothetical protein
MTVVQANGGPRHRVLRDDDAPLALLAGGTTMLSWPDAISERLAAGGRRVVGNGQAATEGRAGHPVESVGDHVSTFRNRWP